MNTVTKPNLQQCPSKLESCREEALRALGQLGDATRALDVDSEKDVGDRCVGDLVRESLYLQSSQRRSLLRKVEAALDRIREGTYGMCDICGDSIARRRLEALPWTDLCLHCQETIEQELQASRDSQAGR